MLAEGCSLPWRLEALLRSVHRWLQRRITISGMRNAKNGSRKVDLRSIDILAGKTRFILVSPSLRVHAVGLYDGADPTTSASSCPAPPAFGGRRAASCAPRPPDGFGAPSASNYRP